MSPRNKLAAATIAAQLFCLYVLFRGPAGFLGPILVMYGICAVATVLTLRSGSEPGCRFLRLASIFFGIPLVLMFSGYALSHDDPGFQPAWASLTFLAAFAIQLVLVIAYRPGKSTRPEPLTARAQTTEGSGYTSRLQEIHDHNRLQDTERRRQEQRGRAMQAETENVQLQKRIRELEAERDKLRRDVDRLRKIVATMDDPFEDLLPKGGEP